MVVIKQPVNVGLREAEETKTVDGPALRHCPQIWLDGTKTRSGVTHGVRCNVAPCQTLAALVFTFNEKFGTLIATTHMRTHKHAH